jgi:hypothetical protein
LDFIGGEYSGYNVLGSNNGIWFRNAIYTENSFNNSVNGNKYFGGVDGYNHSGIFGYSETCINADNDSICDYPLYFNNTGDTRNVDYKPYALNDIEEPAVEECTGSLVLDCSQTNSSACPISYVSGEGEGEYYQCYYTDSCAAELELCSVITTTTTTLTTTTAALTTTTTSRFGQAAETIEAVSGDLIGPIANLLIKLIGLFIALFVIRMLRNIFGGVGDGVRKGV